MNITKNFWGIILKYIFSFLAFSVFIGVLWNFYGDEFNAFHNQQKIELEQKENLKNISFDKIKDIENLKIYDMPSKKFLDDLVKKIDSAQKNVWIEMYIFTEKRVRDAVLKAKKRGVDVKILLEANPYMAPNINKKTFDFFDKKNINVKYSNSYNYSLNHSKFYILDDEVIISTGNLSYSSFTKNKDIYVVIQDKGILEYMKKLFLSDFEGKKFFESHENIILSPLNSREKLTQLLEFSKNKIDLYFEYINDEILLDILFLKEEKNINVRLITDKKMFKEKKEIIEKLQKKGIEVFQYSGQKMHTKAIFVDDKILYLGSINFSTYSIDKNREVGVLIKNSEILKQFKNIYEKDIAKSQVKK